MVWRKAQGPPPFPVGELTDEVRRMLTRHRELLGMTQREVGEAMDPPVSHDAVYAMEQSRGNMSIRKAEHWAAGLGLRMRVSFSFFAEAEDVDCD